MAMLSDEVPVVDEEQLREQLRLILVELGADQPASTAAWLEAQRDALRWLAGEGETAPFTGKAGTATRQAVTEEYSAAMVATLSGDPKSPTGARARGVDRVLHWALGKADAPMRWRQTR